MVAEAAAFGGVVELGEELGEEVGGGDVGVEGAGEDQGGRAGSAADVGDAQAVGVAEA